MKSRADEGGTAAGAAPGGRALYLHFPGLVPLASGVGARGKGPGEEEKRRPSNFGNYSQKIGFCEFYGSPARFHLRAGRRSLAGLAGAKKQPGSLARPVKFAKAFLLRIVDVMAAVFFFCPALFPERGRAILLTFSPGGPPPRFVSQNSPELPRRRAAAGAPEPSKPRGHARRPARHQRRPQAGASLRLSPANDD